MDNSGFVIGTRMPSIHNTLEFQYQYNHYLVIDVDHYFLLLESQFSLVRISFYAAVNHCLKLQQTILLGRH